MKKVNITSLGCPKNFVDTEVMIGHLERDGWRVVEQPEEADIMLVNTCGFIQPAVEEGIDEILQLAAIKESSGFRKLVVTGCMVQRYREKLMVEIPEIDLLVGTEGVREISSLLNRLIEEKSLAVMHIPDRFLMTSALPRRIATPFYRAWMKITEGCNNRCSYCMIPSIRGDLRSREIDDLVEEGKILEEGGVRELSLIAQDLTAFGTEKGSPSLLVSLLREMLARTTLPWLRLLYLYPTGISDEFIKLMAENPRIVPYLDIPFQHVSDRILHRMNRKYGYHDLVGLVERLRDSIPDIAIRTTFLLGFPGEKEEDLFLLEKFLTEMRLDHVGVFGYANEEGCSSASFPDQVEEEEKQRRVDHILSLQADISTKIQEKYRGRVEPVLIEGVSRETDLLLEGRTRYQAPDIDGCVYINEGVASVGEIVDVKITDSQVYDLVGGITGSG